MVPQPTSKIPGVNNTLVVPENTGAHEIGLWRKDDATLKEQDGLCAFDKRTASLDLGEI
jgi:hypothetical protein